MDISKIQAEVAKDETGVVVPINQKSGDPYLAANGTPATVTVVGSESKKYRAARDSISRKMLRGRRTRLEPADLTNNRVEMAAAAVTDWHGWEAGGKPAPCTPENVKALLMAADHILEQVESGISEHADFFANSSKS